MGLINKKQADELIEKIGTKSGQLGEHEMYDPFTAIHWIDLNYVHKIIRDCVYAPPIEPEPRIVFNDYAKDVDWFQRMEKRIEAIEKASVTNMVDFVLKTLAEINNK